MPGHIAGYPSLRISTMRRTMLCVDRWKKILIKNATHIAIGCDIMTVAVGKQGRGSLTGRRSRGAEGLL